MNDLKPFIAAVQRNCHIADARHAQNLSLCTYLLEMREFFRWERGLPLLEAPPREALGAWLSEREALWLTLEGDDYQPLPLDGAHHDPFAAAAINQALRPRGLVYGAGYGRFGKPHFFLGQLLREECLGDTAVVVAGGELARDLTPVPAASLPGSIYVRQEALRRWLWEKVELWRNRESPAAMQRVLDCYDFAADLDAALDNFTDNETETVIWHELGEQAAGRALGPEWETMLAGLTHKRAELLARAVRDNLADSLETLPRLLAAGTDCSLHFWFANLDGVRRSLYPAMVDAYRRGAGSGETLAATAERGARHWVDVARRLLEIWRAAPDEADRNLTRLALDEASLRC